MADEDDPMPALEFEHRACAVCGARTIAQAATQCQQSSDETGERYCKGGADDDDLPDGRLRFVTAASIARLEAWYEREAKRLGYA